MTRDGFQVIELDEVPPMNEDISYQEENEEVEPIVDQQELDALKQKLAFIGQVKPGCDPDELNPRNYGYLPSCWTQKIRAAGKATHKSQSLQGIFC